MNRILFIILLLCSINVCQSRAQSISGVYTTEWQWNMKQKTNWVNQLRLDMSLPLGKGNNSIEVATLHVAKTDDTIIDDWQGFSNIEADNMFAAIAVLGFMHEWKSGHVFLGVRNVNEDFFTSDVTSLFLNGSEGIFPTIAASYPIANYPLSGLTLYFDVTRGAWTFRNSLYNGVGYNGWKRHDNSFLVRPKKDGIFNNSNIRTEAHISLPEQLSTTVSFPSMRMAKWLQPKNPLATPHVHGGYMASRQYGRQPTEA